MDETTKRTEGTMKASERQLARLRIVKDDWDKRIAAASSPEERSKLIQESLSDLWSEVVDTVMSQVTSTSGDLFELANAHASTASLVEGLDVGEEEEEEEDEEGDESLSMLEPEDADLISNNLLGFRETLVATLSIAGLDDSQKRYVQQRLASLERALALVDAIRITDEDVEEEDEGDESEEEDEGDEEPEDSSDDSGTH